MLVLNPFNRHPAGVAGNNVDLLLAGIEIRRN